MCLAIEAATSATLVVRMCSAHAVRPAWIAASHAEPVCQLRSEMIASTVAPSAAASCA